MRVYFTKLIQDEAGVTAIEYGLIAALIAIAAIAAFTAVGTHPLQHLLLHIHQAVGSTKEPGVARRRSSRRRDPPVSDMLLNKTGSCDGLTSRRRWSALSSHDCHLRIPQLLLVAGR